MSGVVALSVWSAGEEYRVDDVVRVGGDGVVVALCEVTHVGDEGGLFYDGAGGLGGGQAGNWRLLGGVLPLGGVGER